ncbi:hypothetical protein U8527_11630 [Kordia algicida OT-1]|uniref:Uncharacterized protein n=1 Tax=Kordia algicida OT-1 TaxID=391587 RepID=A9DZU4_9FLAO|nr:hypothetical protein [Kordia algicida]EDP95763.1 hypothetical protein KAOT1_05147 [Kordia algicida OT-1]
MKTQRKILALKKIQVAKINSFLIIGKGNQTGVDCLAEESRTPKEGKTQSTSNDLDHCPTGS